jgi:hypothetical protein
MFGMGKHRLERARPPDEETSKARMNANFDCPNSREDWRRFAVLFLGF